MILDKIVASTLKRVEKSRQDIPLEQMKNMAEAIGREPDYPFEKSFRSCKFSFICEVKKASPSRGIISRDFSYLEIARDYEKSGACAISVLTEPEFFLGSNEYLKEIKKSVSLPVLRKDFIVDEYQIYESKVIGADAVLLICALLDADTLKKFIDLCDKLGLSALVETHVEEELISALSAGARIIGVNNRDLKTFNVDLNTCINLRKLVPDNIIYVAESGIRTSGDIRRLMEAGCDAVLIGETLMRSGNIRETMDELKRGLI